MGLWSLGVMVGPVLGPTLGGWLTDELSWRWAFFINVPVGVLCYLALLRGMDKVHDATRSRPFDWVGFVLLSMTLALLQLMLDRGHTLDWFESGEIVAEAFFAALFAYAFIVHTLTAPHPFVDPALFRHVSFVVALVLMFIVGLAMLSPTVLAPTFLQTIQGYTAAEAGATQASRGLGAIVAVLIAGRLADRIPARYLISFGILMAFGALLMFSGISVDTPREYIWLAGFFGGFGPPLVFVPLSVAAFAAMRTDQRAEGGVMLTLSRTIGSSIGISIAVSLLARR
jgi:DHA2 family multidrug resistance protein